MVRTILILSLLFYSSLPITTGANSMKANKVINGNFVDYCDTNNLSREQCKEYILANDEVARRIHSVKWFQSSRSTHKKAINGNTALLQK
jgi:hypothetical protein